MDPVPDRSAGPKQKTRSNTLRGVASAVFAVTAVVPLLILVWTLHDLDALFRLQSQVGLGLALAIALLGFYIFRRLMGQMSDLILPLGRMLERTRAAAEGRPGGGATRDDVQPEAAAWARAAARPGQPAPPPRPGAAPHDRERTSAPPRPSLGLGRGSPGSLRGRSQSARQGPSLRPVTGSALTRRAAAPRRRATAPVAPREAEAFRGRRSAVSVISTPHPIVGTLVDLTDDGLVVETEGRGRVAVSYTRISAIDAAG